MSMYRSRVGECSCCLMKGRFPSILSKPIWSNDGASYKDMLCDSLGLEFPGNTAKEIICSSCSVQVKQIYSFRKQVLTANRAVCKADANAAVKIESDKLENEIYYEVSFEPHKMCSDRPKSEHFNSDDEVSSDLDDNIPLNTIPQAINPKSQHCGKELMTETNTNTKTKCKVGGTEEKTCKKRNDVCKLGKYCVECDLQFETEYLKQKHSMYNHLQKCKTCGAQMLGKLLRKHRMKVHGLKCNLCPELFTSWASKYRHKSEVHKQWVKCPHCDHKTFSGAALKKHLVSHKPEKSFACRFCNKTFPRKTTCVMHEYIHTGEKRCLCKFCGERFVQRASLKYHMEKNHPGEQ